ncbi:hypothetical protein [Flavobacterium sp.]|uniref:hypothetical protein n=1 Tax=Flavobacterium sp. TaxID=239 RepID=UPI003D15108E
MNSLEILKNNLIDKILATQNEELLASIFGIFESSVVEGKIALTSEQIEMLTMSENDIQNNKIVDEEQLEKRDVRWRS